MAIDVRALSPDDDRSTFASGNEDLDRFFRRYAGQNQFRHHVGTTYVAVDDGALLGFATVSVAHIEADELPRKVRRRLPGYPLPILRLARLAVDVAARGRGVGALLMRQVFVLAQRLRRDVGCVGVVVDAKQRAVTFYERYGFAALAVEVGASAAKPPPTPMWLPVQEVPEPIEGLK